MEPLHSKPPAKGRGAVDNPAGRFAVVEHVAEDDGWWREEPGAPATTVETDTARRVITENQSPDVAFERSINPYRGCEHGCIYCYARPTHSWLDLSPGLDFETRLFAKRDAADRLADELRHPGYRCKPMAIGVNADAYQPIERTHRITRAVLELLAETEHPALIVTKSAGVLRDLDLLREMAGKNLAQVSVSITTLEPDLARKMEPRAATPSRRLATVGALAGAGVPVSVLVAPIIPGLNDHEMERILEASAEAGARSADTILLRLPFELKTLFSDWLEAHYPARAGRVLSLIRQCRAGTLNDTRFGVRQTGTGPYADLIGHRFEAARKRLGLAQRSLDLDCSRFRPPERAGDQMRLI